jgi:hypothetical protein
VGWFDGRLILVYIYLKRVTKRQNI